MDRLFKIRCSQISKIMGRVGLTDVQFAKMHELLLRKNDPTKKPLTDNMEAELSNLMTIHKSNKLPQTAISYLKEWYADDNLDIYSKYTEKGNLCEDDAIDFAADKLGFGLGEKNTVRMEDDYFTGEPDMVYPKCLVDVKCPWDNESFQKRADFGPDEEYLLQGQGYMHLFGKDSYYLFYALMDTPEEVNRGEVVSFNHIKEDRRWIAFQFSYDVNVINAIIERVKLCRLWLEEYDTKIQSKLGRVHPVSVSSILK